MVRILCLVGLLGLSIGASADEPLGAQIERRYVGRPADVAVEALGEPRAIHDIPRGKAYLWLALSGKESCSLGLQTDEKGTVLNYSFRGPKEACSSFLR